MKINKILFMLVLILLSGTSTAQQQCDCTKIIGSCDASIKITSLTSKPPSHQTEYTITSTAPKCSKVSYFIHGTPYFNVLSNTNKEDDSAFGTKPASIADFSNIRCEVCQSSGSTTVTDGNDSKNLAENNLVVKQSTAKPFLGIWQGTLRWLFVSDPVTITIENSNDRLTGRIVNKSGSTEFTQVNVSANTLTYHFIGDDNGAYTYKMRLTSDREAEVAGVGGIISFTGKVRKVQ